MDETDGPAVEQPKNNEKSNENNLQENDVNMRPYYVWPTINNVLV